jgi:hypothetical protein
MTWRALFAWPDPWALFQALGAEVVERKAGEGDRQGLLLVHFAAQLEPRLTHKNTLHTLNTP